MSTGCNPRHPNASSRSVLGRFWGSKSVLRRCSDVQGYNIYIYITHISPWPPSAMSTPHLGKKLPNLNVTDVRRFTHRVPRGLRHILGSNFEHRHGHSTSQVTRLNHTMMMKFPWWKKGWVWRGGMTYHPIISHFLRFLYGYYRVYIGFRLVFWGVKKPTLCYRVHCITL